MRRTWVDRLSQHFQDETSVVQEWLRGSLLRSYEEVLREDVPKQLLDLLPEQ